MNYLEAWNNWVNEATALKAKGENPNNAEMRDCMRVDYQMGDYYVYLTPEAIDFATKKHPNKYEVTLYYPVLSVLVQETSEILRLSCLTLSEGNNHLEGSESQDRIFFSRKYYEGRNPVVGLSESRIKKLREGELEYIMRRIDGSDKLWIVLENPIISL